MNKQQMQTRFAINQFEKKDKQPRLPGPTLHNTKGTVDTKAHVAVFRITGFIGVPGIVAPVAQPDVRADVGSIVEDVEDYNDNTQHDSHCFQVCQEDRKLDL